MKLHRYLPFIILLATGIAEAQPTADSALVSALQQTLDAEFASQLSTGFSAAISFSDGTMWMSSAGMSDPTTGDSFRTDHRIGFASITKTYVAAVIMQLVEEGVLSLDDTLDKWLPPMQFINLSVTIRQLLNHLSGFYNYTNHPNLTSFALADLEHNWTPEELTATFLNIPVFAPGAGSGYSNTNYILLGMIAKSATGDSLSTLFRDRLLDPNGFDATYLGSEEESTGDIVTTWFDNNNDGSLDNNATLFDSPAFHSLRWAAGGIFSTPKEIALWARQLFTGDIVSSSTRDEMISFLPISGTSSVWTGYGLGIQEFNLAGTTVWGHSGGIRGASSLMVYSPAYDVSIAVAANDNRANHFRLVPALITTIKNDQTATSIEVPERSTYTPEISAFPNPFAERITFSYQIASSDPAVLQIYDLLGREIISLPLSHTENTTNYTTWDGKNQYGQQVPQGIYVYRFQSISNQQTGVIVHQQQ